MKTYQFIKDLNGLESLLNWAANVVLVGDWNAEYPWKSTTAAIGSSYTELITKKLRNISRKRPIIEFLFLVAEGFYHITLQNAYLSEVILFKNTIECLLLQYTIFFSIDIYLIIMELVRKLLFFALNIMFSSDLKPNS